MKKKTLEDAANDTHCELCILYRGLCYLEGPNIDDEN